MDESPPLSARGRVYREVLRLARLDPESKIAPFPRHIELAERVSTPRETVTRALNVLAREGIIWGGRTSLTVLDLERLEEMIV